MEFVSALFIGIFGFSMFGYFLSSDRCRDDIVDIYYPEDLKKEAYDTECPYTKTKINCKDCGIVKIRRSQYDWIKETHYDQYQLKIPFPKREDKDDLHQPKNISN